MKVLICGAGLSGMVLATALKKSGVEVDLLEIHPQWDVLGVGISGLPVPQALERFMARRYERCRIVVENSWQLGEWEKTPDARGADPTALIQASMKALAAPI